MSHKITSFFKTIAYIFGALGLVFIPFPFNIFPYQAVITDTVFGGAIKSVATHVLGIQQYYFEVSSDSSSMFALVFILFCLAILFSLVLPNIKKWNLKKHKVFAFLQTFFSYYLTLQLLNYGVDKIFKSQFYLPEPNILYTPFGQLDKDILFWSTMGTSYAYNMCIGIVQLLAAFLILSRKTRVLGLLISSGVFANIIAINFSFDISVKLYVSFLFILSIIALLPYLYQMYAFFILNKTSNLQAGLSSFSLRKHPRIQPYVKLFVIFLILLEVLSPYVKSGVYNDDLAERPFLHGAYELQEVRNEGTTINQDQIPLKRIFVHRNNYVIFQGQDDTMDDYKLGVDPNTNELTLTDYSLNQRKLQYSYLPMDSILKLQYFYNNKEYQLELKSLDWRSLPALQNRFHWWVDQ